ncbi:MipA/OmpV family protein [Emcibacter sp.]|uniref:MipA/OmpV family protein n=1 Tax=Emcibacter sp. TaxID=1979954 RepID=UPI002AA864B7|nr:MipA/OmpV family protein [Emcibacter sp.]
MSKIKNFILMFLLCLLGAEAPAVRAQDMPQAGPPEAGEQKDWRIFAGIGTIISPEYPGSKSYNVTPIPFGEVRYKGRFFLNPYYGLGARFAKFDFDDEHTLSLSTSLRYSFSNRKESDDPRFGGLGDVDGSVELMLFADYQFGRFNVSLEGAQGLNSSGHGGFSTTLSVEYGQRIFTNYQVQGGPFISFGDEKYVNAFYGVTEAQAAASSFDRYDVGAGFHKMGFKLNVITFITPRIGVYVLGLYNHLISDAADSPLIETRDSLLALAGVAYRF